jgi:hypothetical protein
MASDRALTALQLRRSGKKYREIAEDFRVSTTRVRELVRGAIWEETKGLDEASLLEAFESIKLRPRRSASLSWQKMSKARQVLDKRRLKG